MVETTEKQSLLQARSVLSFSSPHKKSTPSQNSDESIIPKIPNSSLHTSIHHPPPNTMTTGFSMAASWLENISGTNPKEHVVKKDAKDPILQDLHAMKDAETKERGGVHSLPPPRIDHGHAPRQLQHQPKPKFVAHKDPVKAKTKRGKEESSARDRGHMA